MKEAAPELYADLMRRMRRIEGQARGVQRMLEEGAGCEDVVTQLAAIKAALNKVGVKVVACYLSKKMAAEIANGGTGMRAADELMETFTRLG